jgi:hypothetical protein
VGLQSRPSPSLGFVREGSCLWLIYLVFAVALDFILNYPPRL